MTLNQTNKFPSIDYGKLNVLAQLVCYQIEDLFEKLEINLRRSGKMYIGCCPVHIGDNYSALNLYPDGEKVPGIWRCNTRQCHRIFQPTIVGFTRGVLSQKYFNWSIDSPKEGLAPFNKVITWLCKLVGKSWDDIKVDEQAVERNRFANQIQAFKEVATKKVGIPRQSVRANLQIPAKYYVNRGYQEKTLDDYDVGLCTTAGKELFERAVVPIYDETGKFAISFTGRSIFEKCPKCGCYHNPTNECPDKNNRKRFSKWHHIGDTGSTLYNWWNAKQSIRTRNHAILVESPGNVWRLREAGIDNAVGILGTNLTDAQQILLERSGAMKLTILLDNDSAGEIGTRKLAEELYRSYKLNIPKVEYGSYNDIGDMPVEYVKEKILVCL